MRTEIRLDGRMLKILALLTMTIDHTALVLVRHGSEYLPMRLVGRMAFPIYAFLLVQGNIHTRSRLHYAGRLLLFALLSEIPFDLAGHGRWWYSDGQNVFFTLFLAECMLWLLTKVWERRGIPPRGLEGRLLGSILGDHPMTALLSVTCVVGFMLAADGLQTDYGASGILLIALIALVQPWTGKSAVIMTAAAAVLWFGPGIRMIQTAAALTFLVPLAFYDGTAGTGGRNFRWLFYIYYPLHLLILVGIRRWIG